MIDAFIQLSKSYVEAVNRLCAVAGEPPSYEQLARLLAELHLAARCLPDVRWDESDDFDIDAYRQRVDVARVFERLREVLGVADIYPTIRSDAETDVVFGSLADDLADIYGDLESGLLALDGGTGMNNVAWSWRDSFESHWGAHLLDASRTIHRLLTGT